MSEPKSGNISPVASETAAHLAEKKVLDPTVLETVVSTPNYHQPKSSHRWWDAVKSVLLAKAPAEDAPLEYGGHRIAEEPAKLGFFGVLVKFARFFGPGVIISVAYIDPDNFQSAVEDGQDFSYNILFMVLISILIALYLQVSVLRRCTAHHVLYDCHQLTVL
jgi:hypothetical protein